MCFIEAVVLCHDNGETRAGAAAAVVTGRWLSGAHRNFITSTL